MSGELEISTRDFNSRFQQQERATYFDVVVGDANLQLVRIELKGAILADVDRQYERFDVTVADFGGGHGGRVQRDSRGNLGVRWLRSRIALVIGELAWRRSFGVIA